MTQREGVRDPKSHRTPAQIRKMDRGYNARPENIRKRVKNDQARAKYIKEHGAAAVKGKDVDHKKPLRHGGGNHSKNLRAISPSRNRGWRDGV